MEAEHYQRLTGAVASCLRVAGRPLDLETLSLQVEETLGGLRIPEEFLAFLLRTHGELFAQTTSGWWEIREQDGATEPTAQTGAGDVQDLTTFDGLSVPPNGAEAAVEATTDATSEPTLNARPLTPNQAFGHIYESAVEYLETQYKIAEPVLYRERGHILRARGTVAQAPFIEATPAFPTAHKLHELESAYPALLPPGLAELVQHGYRSTAFPLFDA